MVPRQNGFHVPDFPTTRNTTQGRLVSLTLFNVVLDNGIRTWLDITVEDKMVDHERMVETGVRCFGVFYDNDDVVRLYDLDWMQHIMYVVVVLFRKYGLAANVANSRTMTCQPGALWAGFQKRPWQ